MSVSGRISPALEDTVVNTTLAQPGPYVPAGRQLNQLGQTEHRAGKAPVALAVAVAQQR